MPESEAMTKRIEALVEKNERNKRHEGFVKIVKKFRLDFWIFCALALLEKAIIKPFKENASEMF